MTRVLGGGTRRAIQEWVPSTTDPEEWMPSGEPTLKIEIDLSAFEEECPTSEAPYDVEAFARAIESGFMPVVAASVPLDAVPDLCIARGDLSWFELEDDAAALCMRIDGRRTLMEIVSEASLTPSHASKLLAELANSGVVRLRQAG